MCHECAAKWYAKDLKCPACRLPEVQASETMSMYNQDLYRVSVVYNRATRTWAICVAIVTIGTA